MEAFEQKASLLESIYSLIFSVLFWVLFKLLKPVILRTIFQHRHEVVPKKIALGSYLKDFMTPKWVSTCADMSFAQNFFNSALRENWLPSTRASITTLPLAIQNTILKKEGVPKSPVSCGCRTIRSDFLPR
ncbi:hypothetical protein AVEN_195283-1 [Araneus ventricosus]|uniref:Uncharacterized protein n=1 Tax=Araneus ventricosus TaxID=182803 RepID=A0A4Y2G0R4_ARAVE|nr:hypothetical protein AVEN_195283-1 [Araneus ventricosus]